MCFTQLCERRINLALHATLKALGFHLSKLAFKDAIYLRYGWDIPDTSSFCQCGQNFTLDHILSCPMGGFPTIHPNEVRDITASLLFEVCSNVTVEPQQIPILSWIHLPMMSGVVVLRRHFSTLEYLISLLNLTRRRLCWTRIVILRKRKGGNTNNVSMRSNMIHFPYWFLLQSVVYMSKLWPSSTADYVWPFCVQQLCAFGAHGLPQQHQFFTCYWFKDCRESSNSWQLNDTFLSLNNLTSFRIDPYLPTHKLNNNFRFFSSSLLFS